MSLAVPLETAAGALAAAAAAAAAAGAAVPFWTPGGFLGAEPVHGVVGNADGCASSPASVRSRRLRSATAARSTCSKTVESLPPLKEKETPSVLRRF